MMVEEVAARDASNALRRSSSPLLLLLLLPPLLLLLPLSSSPEATLLVLGNLVSDSVDPGSAATKIALLQCESGCVSS